MRPSVLNLPKQRQVCPSLFFQFNMRISVIYGTLSVSCKRVVSVLSLLASNSRRGSQMIEIQIVYPYIYYRVYYLFSENTILVYGTLLNNSYLGTPNFNNVVIEKSKKQKAK